MKFKKKEFYESITQQEPEIPPEIIIDIIKYKVVTAPKVINGITGNEFVAGQVNHNQAIIEISTNRSNGNMKQVLMHEVIHGILYNRNIEKNIAPEYLETVVDELAKGVIQVVRDNPALIKYIETL